MHLGSLWSAILITTMLLSGGAAALAQTATPAGHGQPQAKAARANPVKPGGMAFWRDESIYYLPPGSTKPYRLRAGRFPALSPDGRRLVFRTEPPKDQAAANLSNAFGSGLTLLDIPSGKATAILKVEASELIRDPVWSPAGNRLAFVARTNSKARLDLIRANGSGRRSIFAVGNDGRADVILGLVWAPNGRSVWFHDNRQLYRVSDSGALLAAIPLATIMGPPFINAKGMICCGDRFVPHPTDPQFLAFTMEVEAPPAFTQAFGDELPGICALFLYDDRRKIRTRLTPKDMWASHPCWSRDGRYIYFEGYRQPHYLEKEPFRIYRINRDGRGLQEIAKGRAPSL